MTSSLTLRDFQDIVNRNDGNRGEVYIHTDKKTNRNVLYRAEHLHSGLFNKIFHPAPDAIQNLRVRQEFNAAVAKSSKIPDDLKEEIQERLGLKLVHSENRTKPLERREIKDILGLIRDRVGLVEEVFSQTDKTAVRGEETKAGKILDKMLKDPHHHRFAESFKLPENNFVDKTLRDITLAQTFDILRNVTQNRSGEPGYKRLTTLDAESKMRTAYSCSMGRFQKQLEALGRSDARVVCGNLLGTFGCRGQPEFEIAIALLNKLKRTEPGIPGVPGSANGQQVTLRHVFDYLAKACSARYGAREMESLEANPQLMAHEMRKLFADFCTKEDATNELLRGYGVDLSDVGGKGEIDYAKKKIAYAKLLEHCGCQTEEEKNLAIEIIENGWESKTHGISNQKGLIDALKSPSVTLNIKYTMLDSLFNQVALDHKMEIDPASQDSPIRQVLRAYKDRQEEENNGLA